MVVRLAQHIGHISDKNSSDPTFTSWLSWLGTSAGMFLIIYAPHLFIGRWGWEDLVLFSRPLPSKRFQYRTSCTLRRHSSVVNVNRVKFQSCPAAPRFHTAWQLTAYLLRRIPRTRLGTRCTHHGRVHIRVQYNARNVLETRIRTD